jgi:hypothetical protein
MTQRRLADHFSIRPAAVSQWENDQTGLTARGCRARQGAGLTVSIRDRPAAGNNFTPIQQSNPPLEDVQPHARTPTRYGDAPCRSTAPAGRHRGSSITTRRRRSTGAHPAGAHRRARRRALCRQRQHDRCRSAEGTLVHVHPHRRPRPGQFCVLVKTDGSTFIKRYVGLRGGKMLLAQSNPSKELEIPETQVRAIFLITSAVFA